MTDPRCPGCGTRFVVAQDVTQQVESRRPAAGDIGYCATCGVPFRVGPDGGGPLVALTAADLAELPPDFLREIRAAQHPKN